MNACIAQAVDCASEPGPRQLEAAVAVLEAAEEGDAARSACRHTRRAQAWIAAAVSFESGAPPAHHDQPPAGPARQERLDEGRRRGLARLPEREDVQIVALTACPAGRRAPREQVVGAVARSGAGDRDERDVGRASAACRAR